MIKILLINPPFSREEEYKFWISSSGTKANPPLGLAYIAAACLRRGYKVDIVDALAERLSLEELKSRIAQLDPSVVGVTATTPMVDSAFKVIGLVKEYSKSILTVLGGPHVTAEPFFTMKECAALDIGVLGEGEETFVDLVENYLVSRNNPDSIYGIIHRRKGESVMNAERPPIEDINTIPFPAYRLLPMHLYSPSPFNYRRLPATSMICSRGCPFQCIFCTKSLFGNKVRKLSPRNVYEQAMYLVSNYNIKEVHFYDDTFTLERDWVREICRYLKRLHISWWCNGRVDSVSEDILQDIKSAGCYRIYYGVESGNEKSLKSLKKATSIEAIKNAFKITRKAGIETGAFMMLGIPGEDTEDMRRSIDFTKEIKADHAVFSLLTPYPGTEIYKDHAKYGLMRKASWKDFIMISEDPIFVASSTTKEELKEYLNRAYRSIVFSPIFLKNKAKDIFYSPAKLFLYFKGLISALRGIFSFSRQRGDKG